MAKNWQDYAEMTAALAEADDDTLFRDKSDTTDSGTEGSVKRLKYRALLAASGLTPGGRLTLESGVPVSSTDQTAKGTLYYTPYVHDYVRLYDGARPKLYTFTERSLSLTLTSGKNYDVFLYDNAGTLTLELSAAWTNDTARADALAWQSGVGYVKSGTATRLWLGTIRASGTNTTEDSASKRFVWNAHNRTSRTVVVLDTTDSWTYNTGTWRQKNASAANQFACVCGVAGLSIASLTATSSSYHDVSPGKSRSNGIGYDVTNLPQSDCLIATNNAGKCDSGQSILTTAVCSLRHATGLGYHFYSELEIGSSGDTTTFLGDGASVYYFSGMTGTYDA